MTTIKQIAEKYNIGQVNERVSFLHSEPAAAAAVELAQIESQFTDVIGYNFIWRVGQVLGDAKWFAAVSHEANGVYEFNPMRVR